MQISIPHKNQVKIIITFVVVAILLILAILLGERLAIIDKNIADNERFYMEYNNVPIDNVFKYVDINQAIELFESEQAVIFIGFKECSWCQSYAPILNDVMKENGIDTVYYLNIKKDRRDNTEEYQKLVEMLSNYLYDDENGNKRIYVPDVYFVTNGKIVGHNNDTSIIEGGDVEEYYTESNIVELMDKLSSLAKEVCDSASSCNDDGKGC